MTSPVRPTHTPVVIPWPSHASGHPVRVGISQCLLGEPVRYDGEHKHDRMITDGLGPYVEWVPVCPEVEAGFGVPREAMRLVGDVAAPRMITLRSKQDQTARMIRYTRQRSRDLQALNLAGYVFKKGSPSCGLRRVPVYTRDGHVLGTGTGMFAEAFQKMFPLIPVEDEGRLRDRDIRENFLERVFGYHRWQTRLLEAPLTRGALVSFHTAHKYVILAHSQRHYRQLGSYVANAKRFTPRQLAHTYGRLFMEALAVRATRRKHVNVLQHLAGHFANTLSQTARRDLHDVIHDYQQGCMPLDAPVTLVRHYVRVLNIPYLQDQLYLAPYPKMPVW